MKTGYKVNFYRFKVNLPVSKSISKIKVFQFVWKLWKLATKTCFKLLKSIFTVSKTIFRLGWVGFGSLNVIAQF